MGTRNIWVNDRPTLEVRHVRTLQLGNCYEGTTFRVTSTRRLSEDELKSLYNAGFLGSGQEFRILMQCDGNENPTGWDTKRLVEIDETNGLPTGRPVIDLSPSGFSQSAPYYAYEVETRCDSSG